MLANLTAWFTAQRRQFIYVGVGSIAPLLVYLGIITEGQTGAVLTVATVALQMFGGVLALLNLDTRSAAKWFITSGRAAIYGAAILLAPAAQQLGWLGADQSDKFITVLSIAMTAFASLLSVVTLTPDSSETTNQ